MKNDIVNQAKASVAAKHKSEKVAKTIKVSTLVKVAFYTIVLLAIGAYAGITVNSSINNHINNQVKEQVKSFTEAQE